MALLVREVQAAGYRSLRAIGFPVGRLSVFVGANGVGKTNLYRALQLLQAAASGTLAREIAGEGGMAAAMWAGARRDKGPPRIVLSAGFGPDRDDAGDAPGPAYSYEVAIGFRTPTGAAFAEEPQVKEETLTFQAPRRRMKMLERRGPSVTARDRADQLVEVDTDLMASETALGSLEDPARFPDLYLVRRTMLDWRFYHGLRTDADSPMRRPCLALATPTLASDGANLAAVFATLARLREDTAVLDRAIEDAFPGARLVVPEPGRMASFGMVFPEYPHRVFDAAELSDGTLRYLALAGALLAYRLPAFIALNEPETSLHPNLLEPLARLVATASRRSQIWLVTHSEALAAALARSGGVAPHTVVKRDGATWLDGLMLSGAFREDDRPA